MMSRLNQSSEDTIDQFADQLAQTRNFTLGIPRSFSISPDGQWVVFLRHASGTDPRSMLWQFDVASGNETLIADVSDADAWISDAERTRRERLRELATGIVRYSCDVSCTIAVFDSNGHIYGVRLGSAGKGSPRRVGAVANASASRIDPTGQRIAYTADSGLHVVDLQGRNNVTLLSSDNSEVVYGLPEFVAAEELGRYEGFWWSPDGDRLLVSRVDTSNVQPAYIDDPNEPSKPSRMVRYPFAGSPNAEVTLLISDLDGNVVPVQWDRDSFEYLVSAYWAKAGLLIAVRIAITEGTSNSSSRRPQRIVQSSRGGPGREMGRHNCRLPKNSWMMDRSYGVPSVKEFTG